MSHLCFQCNELVYFDNLDNNKLKGQKYNNKIYCLKCLEAIQFMEDLDTDFIQKDNNIQKENNVKSNLICPFCQEILLEKDNTCKKCNKIHPFYIKKTKTKKKKNRKK